MQFHEVNRRISNVRHMVGTHYAERIYNFIIQHKRSECLELGFAHGATSCCIAAALDELGGGHLTSVDLQKAIEWQKPPIEKVLSQAGLSRYVTIVREKTGYNWFLKKKIEENTSDGGCKPVYDFCFMDGSKNWTIDGFAFFLVDKLLKPGGWILFDDMSWTYAEADKRKSQTDGIVHKDLSEDELRQPHVGLIFRLLVMQHPSYSQFTADRQFGWAQKII